MPVDTRSDGDLSYLPQLTSIRGINRARLISLIRRRPGLTRTALSLASGLSKATVSTLVAELLAEGFLFEDDAEGSRQRNTNLYLNRKAGVAVGIELSAEECRGVLTDMSINTLKHVQRPLGSPRVEEAVNTLAALAHELLADIQMPCLGVAVSVPGATDPAGQSVAMAESLGWSDVPLAPRLAARLRCPVTLINRPRAGVLGEHWYGAGVGIRDLVYVSISSGIAAGILIGGRLFTGANSYCGELGHTIILPDGPECVCGNRGCLEAVASLPAIIRAVQARRQQGESSVFLDRLPPGGQMAHQDIIAAARDGDPIVLEEVRRASRYIGLAVANLVNVLNPHCVIIGGRLAEAGEIMLSIVRETVQRRAFPLSYAGVQIVKSALGLDSVGIGACALVVDQYIAEVEPALQRTV